MLTITFGDPDIQLYDHVNNVFLPNEVATLNLEHSLVSLSKWEQKHHVPFLVDDPKTAEDVMDYVRCMVVTPNYDVSKLPNPTRVQADLIDAYINSAETATTFTAMPTSRGPSERITSELIYYWMVAFNIPWEAQHWHLNRLFTLIRICNVKQQKPQKRSPQEIAMWQREENARRLAAHGTSG